MVWCSTIELLHIECVLLYPVSQKIVSTKWRIYKGKINSPQDLLLKKQCTQPPKWRIFEGKIWTPDTSPSTHSISTNSMCGTHMFTLRTNFYCLAKWVTNDLRLKRYNLVFHIFSVHQPFYILICISTLPTQHTSSLISNLLHSRIIDL